MKKCYECGKESSFTEGEVETLVQVGERHFKVLIKAMICECGGSRAHIDEHEKADLAIAKWLAEHGARDSASFRFMRKVIKLKAVELATLLEVTPTTISRWENGQSPVDRQASVLLGAMVSDAINGVSTTKERLTQAQSSESIATISLRPLPFPTRVHA